MEKIDEGLKNLVDTGKSKGYLTYDQVNDYLPDEAVTPEKLDNLLIALEEMGIELVNEPPEVEFEAASPPAAKSASAADELDDKIDLDPSDKLGLPALKELPKLSDDPVRMYLTQMAEIPLLTRQEEISLA